MSGPFRPTSKPNVSLKNVWISRIASSSSGLFAIPLLLESANVAAGPVVPKFGRSTWLTTLTLSSVATVTPLSLLSTPPLLDMLALGTAVTVGDLLRSSCCWPTV